MTKFCNLLTIIRGSIALLFLSDSLVLRVLSIAIAMITDGLDGYLARRYNCISRLGTLLDPIMDKVFVIFLLGIFLWEGSLTGWQAFMLLLRDSAIILFGLFLIAKGSWHRFDAQSVRAGKLTTFFQFLVMLALTFHVAIPSYLFLLFIPLSIIFWFQLYYLNKKNEACSIQ